MQHCQDGLDASIQHKINPSYNYATPLPKDPGYGSLHDMHDQVDMSPTINIEVICMLWFPSLQERVIINTALCFEEIHD